MRIRDLKARIIDTSTGAQSIEVIVNGRYRGSAPVGLSLSKKAVSSFPNSGISLSFVNVTLKRALSGFLFSEFDDLHVIEETLFDFDTSEKLEKIGGNVMTALEYALLRAGAGNESVWRFLNPHADEMPIFIGECIAGGKHFSHGTDFQEFLIIPHTDSFHDGAYINHYVYQQIDTYLRPFHRASSGSWMSDLDTLEILEPKPSPPFPPPGSTRSCPLPPAPPPPPPP